MNECFQVRCALTLSETVKRSALIFDRIIFVSKYEEDWDHRISQLDFCEGVISCEMPMGGDFTLHTMHKVLSKDGFVLIPVYDSRQMLDKDFPNGQILAYQAVIQCIPTVAEDGLNWEQVLEFRLDKDVCLKYRALRLFLNQGLQAQSVAEAVDIIEKKNSWV